MTWKKLQDSTDLISYERQGRGMSIRLEARAQGSHWDIFKIYTDGTECKLNEEYSVQTRKEAQYLLTQLKKERSFTKDEIDTMLSLKQKKASIAMHRMFKELDVEKWELSIAGDEHAGFAVVRYTLHTDVDIVVHEMYRALEQEILDTIKATLGLEEIGASTQYHLYFFSKHLVVEERPPKKDMLVSRIEMGFDFETEE
ncbi:hypothetical protein HZB01_02655 [Candidatus Woesearchaeota archaeon]|nr:hypothetical protein [Candidatus Woesearchaeota archaeon]